MQCSMVLPSFLVSIPRRAALQPGGAGLAKISASASQASGLKTPVQLAYSSHRKRREQRAWRSEPRALKRVLSEPKEREKKPSFSGADPTRREVGGDIDHVVDRQFLHNRFHQIHPYIGAIPILHIEELAYQVARKAPGDSRHRIEA